jgi:pyruvate dehydrogenase E2 component (dihydrolipoamide acetyltransferase)
MKILMPQLGETVTEGTIAAWHFSAGDMVEKDELLLDVETDKVATEIPSPISGVLRRILVEEGDTVDVGTVLAVIGDDDSELEADSPGESVAEDTAAAPATPAAPVERRPARTTGGERLSPAVRKLVAQHQLDISLISGTGRNGRVTRQDVLDRIENQSASEPVAEGNRIPFDRIRRVTAEHMVRSKTTSPHVLQAIDVKFHAVDAVRRGQADAWKAAHGYSLSYLSFIAHAVCRALVEFPRLNASVDGQSLVLHDHINLAIAVDLNHEGLLAPVIRNAGELSVPELAVAIRQLAERARDGALGQDDLSGGTYTLSNPGPYGTLFTAPIINQPQVGILSVDAISKRAVVEEGPGGDDIVIRPVGVLAHSFDHRAVDGAYSAAFLARVKRFIEDEDWSGEFNL